MGLLAAASLLDLRVQANPTGRAQVGVACKIITDQVPAELTGSQAVRKARVTGKAASS